MKHLFLISALFLSTFIANAQAPTIQWERFLQSQTEHWQNSRAVIKTDDGGYAVTGINRDFYWLSKLNNNGELMWEKEYQLNDPEASFSDSSFALIQTNDGGFAILGSKLSKNGYIYNFHYKYSLIKVDENGNLEWEKKVGHDNSRYQVRDNTNINFIQMPDNGFLIPGKKLYKLASDGTLEWEKDDFSNRRYYGLCNTDDAGFVAVGTNDKAIISKYDNLNNLEWELEFGGSEWDAAFEIKQNADGEYLIVGQTQSNDGDVLGNHGGNDALVLKVSANGQVIWHKYVGDADHNTSTSLDLTADNGFIIAGYTTNHKSLRYDDAQLNVYKFDEAGEIDWEYNGPNDVINGAHSVIQSNDLSYVVAGFKQTGNNKFETSGWVFNLSSNPLSSQNTLQNEDLKVFPNPTTGIVNFENTVNNSELKIYDLNGKLLINQIIPNNTHLCNIDHLKNGVYFYEIYSSNLKIKSTGKLIKK